MDGGGEMTAEPVVGTGIYLTQRGETRLGLATALPWRNDYSLSVWDNRGWGLAGQQGVYHDIVHDGRVLSSMILCGNAYDVEDAFLGPHTFKPWRKP